MAFTQGDDLNILQQTDASVVSAGAGNDTYVLAPDSLAVGQSVTLNDARGTNTLKLTGGLEIVSSKVASNTLQLTLSNEAVVTLNGAAGYRFDVGGTALSDGVAKNFAGFARDVLGVTVPQSGLAEGGAISVNDILPINPDVDLPARVIYETEPNDQLSHANSAAFGDTLKGTSGKSSDRDVFKLEATEGGRVTLDFTHPNGPGSEGAQIAMALADAAGNVISERTFRGNDTLNVTVPDAGTYHVIIKDQSGYGTGGVNGDVEPGLYAVKTQFEPAADTAFDAAQNDTFSRAVATLADGETPLAFGHELAGTVNQSGDKDVYRVSADEGGAIIVDVTHPNGPGGDGAKMQIELFNLQGELVTERDFRGDITLNASVAEAGDYYLRVYDESGYGTGGVNGKDEEDGFYHLATGIETHAGRAYDTAGNTTLATAVKTLADGATPLDFTHDLQGTVAYSGNVDVFRFTAGTTADITAQFTHPNGPGAQGATMAFDVLDAQGEQILENDKLRGNADDLLFSVTQSEDYYVRVYDKTGYGTGGAGGQDVEDNFYQVDFLIA